MAESWALVNGGVGRVPLLGEDDAGERSLLESVVGAAEAELDPVEVDVTPVMADDGGVELDAGGATEGFVLGFLGGGVSP